MQQKTNWNFLIVEDIKGIPFSNDCKRILHNTNFSNYLWQTYGLPIPFATYALVDGKSLYLDALPGGETKVEKSNFTGDILMSGFFIDEKKEYGYNYLVTFLVTILKGEIVEIILDKEEPQDIEDYERAYKLFEYNYLKNLKMFNSWLYRWIYAPYAIIIRKSALFLVLILECIIKAIYYIARLIAPI